MLAGCGPGAARPVSAPRPVAPGTILLRDGWVAEVTVDQQDSIILTLPSGDRQFQHFVRHARFHVLVDSAGRVAIRLDTLTVDPRRDSTSSPLDASWSGRLGDGGMTSLRVTSGGERAQELAPLVADLLPRLPRQGIKALSTWGDSGSESVRVDIFNANEHRTATWNAASLIERNGLRVLPIRLHETFEQLGDGNQEGTRISMTSQGRRSGTYYVTSDGRVTGAELTDSIAMLISVPSRKQIVPTTRLSRVTVRFFPQSRAS